MLRLPFFCEIYKFNPQLNPNPNDPTYTTQTNKNIKNDTLVYIHIYIYIYALTSRVQKTLLHPFREMPRHAFETNPDGSDHRHM